MAQPEPLRFGFIWWLSGLPLLLFFCLPLLALVSFSTPALLLEQLASDEARRAIKLSSITSLWTLGLTIFLGTPVALLVAKGSSRFSKFLDTLIDLPMVLPPAVAGLALLLAFGRNGLFGAQLSLIGLQIPFTPLAVILAQLFVAGPLFVRAAISGIRRSESHLEEAALLDGATSSQVVRFITLPLARPALLGGAILTWARAIGEFGATILFAGNLPGITQTMPLAIYLGFETSLDLASSLALLLLAISFTVLLLVRYFIKEQNLY